MLLNTSIKQAYFKYALKGAVIVLLALLSAYLLNIQESYWVLFGAIAVTKLHAGISFYRGKQRVYGTIIGVGVSVLLTALLMHWPWGLVIIIPFCIFGASYYFSKYTVCIVFITVIFVSIIALSTHNPIHYGVARIFDTLLGVSLAVMVTSYFWPNYATKAVEMDFQRYFLQVEKLFSSFTQAFIGNNFSLEEKSKGMQALDEIYEKLKENSGFVEYEFDESSHFQEQASSVFCQMRHLYSLINLLGNLAIENALFTPNKVLYQLLVTFIDKAQKNSSVELSNEIQQLFDYLQHTAGTIEQEQRGIIGAFVQAVSDVTNEMWSARQVSQDFFQKEEGAA